VQGDIKLNQFIADVLLFLIKFQPAMSFHGMHAHTVTC